MILRSFDDIVSVSFLSGVELRMYHKKVRISMLQAVEALRITTGKGSYIT
jgi:hypothetical protein